MSLGLLLAFGMGSSSATAAGGPIALRLSAPLTAHVGDVVAVDVETTALVDVAAFEVTATVNAAAANFEAGETDVPGAHRAPMSMTDGSSGVLAAYSPAGAAHGPSDTLGVLYVRLNAPGRVEVRTGPAVFADDSGARLSASRATASAFIDVAAADGTGGPAYPAAPARWDLPDQAAGAAAWPTVGAARADWQISRLAGAPCAAQSAPQAAGCVDVADVQRTATSTSAVTASSTSAPTIGAAAVTTYIVNSTGDTSTAGMCTTVSTCTLRAAVAASNADGVASDINFAIGGTGPFTIQLGSAIVITDGGTTINGYSQPGSVRNSDPVIDNAILQIQLRGNGPIAHDNLVIESAGNTMLGLSSFDTRRPFWIDGPGATGNVIQGNFIGTNAAGTFAATTDDSNGHGIHLQNGAANTLVGGTNPQDRNVISGNARTGVGMWDQPTDNTVIYGNIIGLNPSATASLPNRMHGVDFNFGASGGRVGGLLAGQRNLISGNRRPPVDEGSAIEISHTPGTTDNQVVGNFIGTDKTGNAAPAFAANGNTGVYIEDGARANLVANNIIVNNNKGGVRILNGASNVISDGNVVRGNFIGVTANGTAAGNGQLGVSVDGTHSVIDSNIIANNGGAGILSGLLYNQAKHNTFTKNSIFDNAALSIDLIDQQQRRGINFNDPGDGDDGPNTLLNYPLISQATTTGASGNACDNCIVELFATGALPGGKTGGFGPSRTFVASTTANSQGQFQISYPGIPLVGSLTATATDLTGNTSEVGQNVKLVQGTGAAPPPPQPLPTPGTSYVTMRPARILETRTGDPAFVTIDGQFQGIGIRDTGSVTVLQVNSRAGVPADASAVVLNITATEAPIPGFVTVYPCGADRPTASNLNFVGGSTIPNLVISKVAADGTVCIFTSSATHLIADVNGFFPAAATYNTMVPARLLETRTGDPAFITVDGQQQGIGIRPVGATTELQVTGRAGVPADAAAVVLNVTATQATIPGFVTVYPCGSPQPTASNLNYVAGSTIPNLVIAKVGDGGKVCLFNTGPTHLVADINGFFPAATSFVTMVPARLLETRSGDPAFATVDGTFQGIGIRETGAITELQVTGRAGVPAGASAVVLNVTATDATLPGFVTVYPCGTDVPTASNLNYVAGSTIPNLVIAQVGIDGQVCLFNSAPTHLIADINGYFPAG